MARQIVVHGHFYQPPRENPWTGTIETQPSAAPAHDWNQRVHDECYEPNAFVHIDTPAGPRTVNNFERLSFNVGPTLMSYLQGAQPGTYERIIEADRISRGRLGHGNAIAQAFHHTILPLSPLKDVRTQIRWGIADFRHRFGRDPEGMWLGETACNPEALGVLIDEGIRFTVLSPYQASIWREDGGDWVDGFKHHIDTRHPYRYTHVDNSGREITLFFYDDDIARTIAFERATTSAERFLSLFIARTGDGLIHAATDGETYGHHHKFADLGLAHSLFVLAEGAGIDPTNYAAYLAGVSVRHEARVVAGEGSSWSCAHGVARWKRHCGCYTGGEPGWNQYWRTPLRVALEVVRDAADDAFVRFSFPLLSDPWGARDRYVQVVLEAQDPAEFVSQEQSRSLSAAETEKVLTLMEMQLRAMEMFTSCGWFFNDIAGIETVQNLLYAGRTMELIDSLGAPVPLHDFLSILEHAHSNDAREGNGAEIFRRALESARPG